ncbi:hypothetical protein DID88_006591 [Monilinia fructigena]|uniref:N-acetyltransferase domain-containing protein n=1 Tax=Monilinia fructigena TaxID=38457 RepID=A0A395IH43_9HELO|nr:hypothetical protein DID88_006591 [Monilinia fructigena]
MANQSKLIRTTVRDPEQEKARLTRMTTTAFANYEAFVAEMIDLTGEATGLASSRWAIGEQKNYKIVPGGPRNLDLCDNSIARGKLSTSSLSPKMVASLSDKDLNFQLAQLGGLKNSRFSQSSSKENLSWYLPSSVGEVAFASSPTVIVKGVATKKVNHQQTWEHVLCADHNERMVKLETVTSANVERTSEPALVSVSSPTIVVRDAIVEKLTAEKLMEQMLLANFDKRKSKFQPAASIEANTVDNDNVSVASREPSVTSKATSIVEDKSIIHDVSITEDNDAISSHSQAISTGPSIMQENKFLAMLVKAQAERIAKTASVSATPTPNVSVSVNSIAPTATVPIASIASSPVVTIATLNISPIATPCVASVVIPSVAPVESPSVAPGGASIGRFMMKENEFMAMLIKKQQEKVSKRESILASALQVKKEDLKVNIQQAKSDFSHPQTQNSTQVKVISKINNNLEHKSELPTIEKSIFATQTSNPSVTIMSNKPLIPAPINKWTTSKLTIGKALSKADEDFQTFVANKTAATAAAARRQQQTATESLSPNPAQQSQHRPKSMQTSASWLLKKLIPIKLLLIALQLHQPLLLRNSLTTIRPILKVLCQRVAILRELRAASKDFITNNSTIEKVNIINTNSIDEEIIDATSISNNKPANTADNLAAIKGESSQDKVSHVAVHSIRLDEKENVNHTKTQINNPFIDKLFNKKQAGSLASSPPFWSISSISDIDIGDKRDNSFPGVRHLFGRNVELFDANYIPSYIKEWSAVASPIRPVTTIVDTTAEGFVSGEDLVNNVILTKAPIHEPTIPDTLNSSNEKKRLNQTAGQEAAAYLKKAEKVQKAQEYSEAANHASHQELMAIEPEPNPFTPKIDIYLRPATETDVKQILQIYNHYIAESYIPEDQEPLTESDIMFIIAVTKQQKLPFVVAVKGRVPTKSTNPKIKTKVPQYENVIGFGYTEMRGCGIAGKSTGRSRYTHNMHFYVHQDYTRKGVGSCVLDRLLKVSSRAWSGHDGYDWLNPNHDPAYEHGCGARCHQMLIEVPVLKKNDPNYEWMKIFLRKFWFMDEFKLRSVGRTSVAQHAGEWLDVVHFQKELEHEAEFTPFI